MSEGGLKLASDARRIPSDPILLGGWPESAVDTVESVLSGFQPTAISNDVENSELNPFKARLRRFSSSAQVDELEQAVALNDRTIVILCLPDIHQVLADEAGSGAFAGGCEGQWTNALNAFVRLRERDPDRVFLVLPEDALSSPQQFADALSEHVGYRLNVTGEARAVPLDRWRSLYQRLARMCIAEDEELSRASAELRSERLFVTLHQLEPGMEWLAVSHEIETLRKENGVLVELAHRLQSQLEERVLQSEQDSDQIAEIRADLTDQKQALQRIRSSTSWKVTRPLRSVVSLLRKSSHRG